MSVALIVAFRSGSRKSSALGGSVQKTTAPVFTRAVVYLGEVQV